MSKELEMKARAIVESVLVHYPEDISPRSYGRIKDELARAVAQLATPPANHVRGSDGVDMTHEQYAVSRQAIQQQAMARRGLSQAAQQAGQEGEGRQ